MQQDKDIQVRISLGTNYFVVLQLLNYIEKFV